MSHVTSFGETVALLGFLEDYSLLSDNAVYTYRCTHVIMYDRKRVKGRKRKGTFMLRRLEKKLSAKHHSNCVGVKDLHMMAGSTVTGAG